MSDQDEDQRMLDAFIKRIDSKYEYDRPPRYKIELQHNPPGSERESWHQCYELARKYDKGLCDAYREEIDTLLVFAGLFSAVVTAFTVESYQWLHDDSGDVSVQLLAHIATILNHSAPIQVPPMSALSGAVAARINFYWFLSLVLSLSAALVGILAKQWIREYSRDAGRTDQESLGVRQMRLEGLEKWKVSEIVTCVPLLLQAALVLFFIGIIELLSRLNAGVAAPVTIGICMVLCFYVATTVLPAFHLVHWDMARGTTAQCPYKSPQAWLALLATMLFTKSSPHRPNGYPSNREEAARLVRQAGSWMMLDVAWTAFRDAVAPTTQPEFSFQALAWLHRALGPSEMLTMIWHCLQQTLQYSSSGSHSLSNIICCTRAADDFASRLPAYADRYEYGNPRPPPICDEDEWMRSQFHLLVYALKARMPRETYVDLLFQVLLRAESWESLTETDYSNMMDWFSIILVLPETSFDDLFLVIYHATRPRADPMAFAMMIRIWTKFLRTQRPSQHHTQMILAFCARMRWWLDVNGTFKPSLQPTLRRANACAEYLELCMDKLREPPYEVEDGPPYSPETVVFAYLARDIDTAIRRLKSSPGPGINPKQVFIPVFTTTDAFIKLVNVVKSNLGGSVLGLPEGLLADDVDGLSDGLITDASEDYADGTVSRADAALTLRPSTGRPQSDSVPRHSAVMVRPAVDEGLVASSSPLAPQNATVGRRPEAGPPLTPCAPPNGDGERAPGGTTTASSAHDIAEGVAMSREVGAAEGSPPRALCDTSPGSVASPGPGSTESSGFSAHPAASLGASMEHRSPAMAPEDSRGGPARCSAVAPAPRATGGTTRAPACPARQMQGPTETGATEIGSSSATCISAQMPSSPPSAQGRPSETPGAEEADLLQAAEIRETALGQRGWEDLEAGLVRRE